MRRVGLVLAGLGTCHIVFAVLMPTWVSSRVLKFPLNQYASVTLAASNASYFSPTKLTEMMVSTEGSSRICSRVLPRAIAIMSIPSSARFRPMAVQ